MKWHLESRLKKAIQLYNTKSLIITATNTKTTQDEVIQKEKLV